MYLIYIFVVIFFNIYKLEFYLVVLWIRRGDKIPADVKTDVFSGINFRISLKVPEFN